MGSLGYVFVSHSHKDIVKVREIRNKLEDAGIEPILFYLRCMDSSQSEDKLLLERLIHNEIDARELFLYIDSSNARQSPWVQNELAYVQRYKKDGLAIISLDENEGRIEKEVSRIIRAQTVVLFASENSESACNSIADSLQGRGFLVSRFPLEYLSSDGTITVSGKPLNNAQVLVFLSEGDASNKQLTRSILALDDKESLDFSAIFLEERSYNAFSKSNNTTGYFRARNFVVSQKPTERQIAGIVNHCKGHFSDAPWGPNRATYSWQRRPQYAVFNSITDNPSLGDERGFVRIKKTGCSHFTNRTFTLEAGETYDVYIYYHNNADPTYAGRKAVGIADGVVMTSNFPHHMNAGKSYSINATISANGSDPLAVWSGIKIRSNGDCFLEYIPGSAIIHNGGKLDGTSIGPSWLFGKGSLLGYNKFSGLLPGGSEYAGYVTYKLLVSAQR